jgi:hypothetical protein
MSHPVVHALPHQPGENTQGDAPAQAPPLSPPTLPTGGRQTDPLGTTVGETEETNRSFFDPAQTRVGESAPPASAVTTTHTASATDTSSGTALPEGPGKASKERWPIWTGTPSVSTGSYPEAADPPPTPRDTDAPDAERHLTVPKTALEQKRHKATSPYNH